MIFSASDMQNQWSRKSHAIETNLVKCEDANNRSKVSYLLKKMLLLCFLNLGSIKSTYAKHSSPNIQNVSGFSFYLLTMTSIRLQLFRVNKVPPELSPIWIAKFISAAMYTTFFIAKQWKTIKVNRRKKIRFEIYSNCKIEVIFTTYVIYHHLIVYMTKVTRIHHSF